MMTGVILMILMYLNPICIMEEKHIQKMEVIHMKIFTPLQQVQQESKIMLLT